MTAPIASSHARSLGVVTCSALVVGNIIGSGFFLSPAALAPYGYVALIGWVLMAGVAICIALLFARLARILPSVGGPYAYARQAFGPQAGFIVAWTYWISMWVSQPAIAITFVGYLGVFFPGIGQSRLLSTAIGLAAIWAVALVNIRGVRSAAILQNIMVGMKLVPFIAIGSIGLFWVSPATLALPPDLPAGAGGSGPLSTLFAIASVMPLIMFAFLGIESSTVPADNVRDPARTIPRATILGTLICAAIFILCTVTVMGVVPRATLAASSAPFADAARLMWGDWAGDVLAAAVIFSSLAALNGWTLVMGQVPLAAARDGLFPPIFARLSRSSTPAAGIAISLVLSSLMLLLQASGLTALVGVYRELINLSTTAEMVPYAFCAAAETTLLASLARPGPWADRPFTLISLIAFTFSLVTIYGGGAAAGLWTMILTMIGIPVYAMMTRRQPPRDDVRNEEPQRSMP
ncbi:MULTISPECIES: amino acid permease [Mesorhizobium]|uniref:Arginine/agmatine antiporter n=1 Tax=Rhizobium loti TaxID=381 RepID=A0A6M7U8J1_RHILI|nr:MULTISPECIES: amino acid permease [Mesorhizobium]KRB31910.1 transporter [Mesorhizobium sp. Root172]OBQ72051.1 transporter [Mesorhizobium loti]QKC72363.1 amino acid permease [Mesorhizobium loti]